MANYYSTTRTNYFTVTNEDRYAQLFAMLHCDGDGDVEDFTKIKDGKTYHGFGAYANIECYPYRYDEDKDNESNFDYFLTELQKILPEKEVFAIMSAGHEKLCCVDAYVIMVSKNEIKSTSTNQWIEQTAKEMTNNPDFRTEYQY